MTRKLYLSVDFDYFVRTLPAWDWGHSESPFFRTDIWQMRAFPMPGGWDLEAEMSPDRHSLPHPRNFVASLKERGVTFAEDCSLFVSDSHLWAYESFDFVRKVGDEADLLLNFDAHHDFSYSYQKAIEVLKGGTMVRCDDWLLHMLLQYRQLRARVIYPEWKEKYLEEWSLIERVAEGCADYEEAKIPHLRVDKAVWPNPGDIAGEVVAVHVAQSGAWVPPWLDNLFVEFVESFELEPENYYMNEGIDPLEPRPWEWPVLDPDVVSRLTATLSDTVPSTGDASCSTDLPETT